MKQVLFSLIFLFTTIYSMAQKNSTVKGIAFDSLANRPVVSATVSLLENKDSSLVSFTMTDNAGRFE